MSLGQRINGNMDKSLDLTQNERERYENQIRLLKVLSKSQTSFLKAYLGKKLKEAEEIVNRAASHIEETKGDARKAKDIKAALKNLKLHELEADVTSAQLAVQKELTLLRTAAEQGYAGASTGNGSAPAAPAQATSAEASKQIAALEADNNKLRELLADAQKALKSAPAALPPAPPAASTAAAASNSAETIRFKQEIELLRDQVSELTRQVASKEEERQEAKNAVAELRKSSDQEIQQLRSTVAELRKHSGLVDEVAKLQDKVRQLEKEKAALQTEWASKLEQQVAETRRDGESKLKALQDSFNAEREEMEVALAQELEDVEKAKDEEILKISSENVKLRNALETVRGVNQNLFAKLKGVSDKLKAVQRDYKQQAKETGRELADMAMALRSFMSGGLVGKLKSLSQEMHTINTRYKREMSERKRLHNLVQELKGNIRVFMRCRPPTPKELEQGSGEALCVSFPNPGEVRVLNEKGREKVWEFDEVFDFNTKQQDVYNDVSALVTSVLDGFNVCIFAYGQTGSGKTFTMMGPPDNRGVNTRALEELFVKVRERSAEYRDTVAVSILEVYNEEIRDLLGDSGEKLEVKIGEYGNYVPGLSQIEVENINAVFQLLVTADRNRSSATTNMNEHSSRSHMMLTVTVISEFKQTGAVTRGKLNLVDLAGSERINKSGAQGQALKEAQNINKSLSALGDVIAARAQKNAHIPFRNSTLTYLLQDSLSQDSKTLMIVCISPVVYNAEETFCSLNFAARVRTVELGRASKNLVAASGGVSAGGSVSAKVTAGPTGAAPLNRRTSTGGK